jgi:hypothetical protein
LSGFLNEESFEYIASSQERNIVQLDKNILTCTFPNINLQSVSVNDSLSKGWFQFRIKPKLPLQIGTTIANSADIYFDFNTPIRTNIANAKYCTTQFVDVNKQICSNESVLFHGQQLTTSGIYYDTLQSGNSCDSVIRLNLVVVNVPVPTVVTNGKDSLFASGGVSYQWFLNNIAINGATFSSYKAQSNGSYTVKVFDANGCSNTSNVINIATLGTIALINEGIFQVFPNPSNGVFSIKVADDLVGSSCIISDAIGRVVFEKEKMNNLEEVVLLSQWQGVYFVSVQSKNLQITRRVTLVK